MKKYLSAIRPQHILPLKHWKSVSKQDSQYPQDMSGYIEDEHREDAVARVFTTFRYGDSYQSMLNLTTHQTQRQLSEVWNHVFSLETQLKNTRARLTDVKSRSDLYHDRITVLEKWLASLREPDTTQVDDLWQQSEIARKELMSVFDIDPDDKVDTKKLDGLLEDFADEKENSLDLIRTIRGS